MSQEKELYGKFKDIANLCSVNVAAWAVKKEVLQEQKAFVESQEGACPTFVYEKPSKEKALLGIEAAETFKGELIHEEDLIKELYTPCIEEVIESFKGTIPVAEKQDGDFFNYIVKKYPITEEDFSIAVSSIRNSLKKDLSSSAKELLELLPKIEEKIQLPSQEVVLWVQSYVHEHFHEMLAYIDTKEDREYSMKEGEEILQNALMYIPYAQEEGWSVVIDPDREVAATNRKQKKLFLPGADESVTYTRKRLKELSVHEFGVHIYRALQGERSDLALLNRGLAGYLENEEGLAACFEQALSGEVTEYFGVDRTLAIGLALGMDGTKRTYRDVYELMLKYYTIQQGEEVKAKSSTWKRLFRTYRGLTDTTSGYANTRDNMYMVGNIAMWKYFENLYQEQKEFPTFLLVGKYDPLNETQKDALQKLGII